MIINTKLDLFKYPPAPKKDAMTDKELSSFLVASPTKKQHKDALQAGQEILKVSEATKNKMADEWMRGGGRDPKGRSLDEEIKLGKEEWLKSQRVAKKTKPKPQYINGNVIDLKPVLDDPWWLIKPEPPEEETIRMPERRYGIATLIKN